MERMKLKALLRDEVGKNKVKKIKKEGLVPACLYKQGKETINLKVEKHQLYDILHTKAGENVLVDLIIDRQSTRPRPVMIKEVQYHPLKDEILHVDFNEVSLTKAIKVNVPVTAKGEAEAVIKEEGTIEHIMWEVEVECLPTQIPERLEVDVSGLKIGDKIFVKDLIAPEGVKIVSDPELIVISAEPPRKVEEVIEAVAAGEEAAEPEVIAKGKKEEEAEATKEPPPKPEKSQEKKTE